MSQGLIQGSMREAPLPDIIQLVSQGGKSGCFHITEDPKRAKIFLKDGRISHAITNDAEGLEAVYEVALWLDGHYHFEEGEQTAPVTITKSNATVLMEMHRRMDEWRVINQKISSLDLYPVSTLLPGETPHGVNPREAKLLSLVTGFFTVAELAEVLQKPVLTVAKDLYGLVMAGHVVLKGIRSGRRPELPADMAPPARRPGTPGCLSGTCTRACRGAPGRRSQAGAGDGPQQDGETQCLQPAHRPDGQGHPARVLSRDGEPALRQGHPAGHAGRRPRVRQEPGSGDLPRGRGCRLRCRDGEEPQRPAQGPVQQVKPSPGTSGGSPAGRDGRRTLRQTIFKALTGACLLLLTLTGCVELPSTTTGEAVLYVYDGTSHAVLSWDDLPAIYDGGSAGTASRTITSGKLTGLSLGWGGMALDRSNGYLYLVSSAGTVVRISRIGSQSGAVSSGDVISFSLDDAGTDAEAGGVFGQAAVNPVGNTLYVTESDPGSGKSQIWAIASSLMFDGATLTKDTATLLGNTSLAGGTSDKNCTGVAASSTALYGYFDTGGTINPSGTDHTGEPAAEGYLKRLLPGHEQRHRRPEREHGHAPGQVRLPRLRYRQRLPLPGPSCLRFRDQRQPPAGLLAWDLQPRSGNRTRPFPGGTFGPAHPRPCGGPGLAGGRAFSGDPHALDLEGALGRGHLRERGPA